MADPAVLFVKPGAVKAADKTALRKAGVIVVEIADPNEVRFVRAEGVLGPQEMSHGDMLVAAVQAISGGADATTRKLFVDALAQALSAPPSAPKEG
jgi:hypothetical protein